MQQNYKRYKLEKISDIENLINPCNVPIGKCVIGSFKDVPLVGGSFYFQKEVSKGVSMFRTSIVSNILETTDSLIIFETMNSRYKLEVMKQDIKDVYADIQRINKIDPATPTLRLCKFFEEAGEFAQAVNKKLGRKTVTETDQEVLDLIKEEAADTIQCLLSFADSYDLGYKHFIDEFNDDSHDPEGLRPEVALRKVFKYVGGIVYRFEKKSPELIDQFNRCISKVLTVAYYYGIKESEVVAEISRKNIKWEKVAKIRVDSAKKNSNSSDWNEMIKSGPEEGHGDVV